MENRNVRTVACTCEVEAALIWGYLYGKRKDSWECGYYAIFLHPHTSGSAFYFCNMQYVATHFIFIKNTINILFETTNKEKKSWAVNLKNSFGDGSLEISGFPPLRQWDLEFFFLCISCFSSIYVINISYQSLGLSMWLILTDITAAHKAAVSGKYSKQSSRVRERTYFQEIKCQCFIMCRWGRDN